MKDLLAFMVACLLIGTLWDYRPARRYLAPIGALSIIIMIGYYYFNRL